jgi:hypothetical protein
VDIGEDYTDNRWCRSSLLVNNHIRDCFGAHDPDNEISRMDSDEGSGLKTICSYVRHQKIIKEDGESNQMHVI